MDRPTDPAESAALASELRADYVARINRVIDHIEADLGGDLRLERLAEVAHFSPFHFHRIFKAMMGETLNQFVQRLRLERAAQRLVANPRTPITEIALDCGFASSATFARAFRDAFGTSASGWRRAAHSGDRKMRKAGSKTGNTDRKSGKASGDGTSYPEVERRRITMTTATPLDIRVTVDTLPETEIAYVRHVGAYQGKGEVFAELFGKLGRWAGPRGLLQGDVQMLSVYHDDPDITDEAKQRVTAGLVVPADTPAEGEVGRMALPGGRYAVARAVIDGERYGDAWDFVYGEWLPESGYQPDDRPALEFYRNDPAEHPESKHIVDICVPVKPL